MEIASLNTISSTWGACDLICFSHLRWDFVYQRPQHLMSRFAKHRRVFFVEEPIFHNGRPILDVSLEEDGLYRVVPMIPHGTADETMVKHLTRLTGEMFGRYDIDQYVSWYYTPMMLAWSEHLKPAVIVYDCMDELSGFKNAPAELRLREAELFSIADLVFTGGMSLYEAKCKQHNSVFGFPSSIDVKHFSKALEIQHDPPDQEAILHPRIGFVGVIDERLDIDLLAAIADLRPEWSFVMIGPVVKIDEADLPRRKNIYYLGSKKYRELPEYIAGWDAAMMPFALNDSTRYISPTKTPEYLAAGRPVVSTRIRDVVHPYGELGLVEIADTPEQFVSEIEKVMASDPVERREKAVEFLSDMSWDKTFNAMCNLIEDAILDQQSFKAAARI